jgi:hypothetical protein
MPGPVYRPLGGPGDRTPESPGIDPDDSRRGGTTYASLAVKAAYGQPPGITLYARFWGCDKQVLGREVPGWRGPRKREDGGIR